METHVRVVGEQIASQINLLDTRIFPTEKGWMLTHLTNVENIYSLDIDQTEAELIAQVDKEILCVSDKFVIYSSKNNVYLENYIGKVKLLCESVSIIELIVKIRGQKICLAYNSVPYVILLMIDVVDDTELDLNVIRGNTGLNYVDNIFITPYLVLVFSNSQVRCIEQSNPLITTDIWDIGLYANDNYLAVYRNQACVVYKLDFIIKQIYSVPMRLYQTSMNNMINTGELAQVDNYSLDIYDSTFETKIPFAVEIIKFIPHPSLSAVLVLTKDQGKYQFLVLTY